jgi:hypothetical protein
MSTTWCFLGILAGREISCGLRKQGTSSLNKALKVSAKDLLAVSFGFIISLLVAMGANPAVRQMISNIFD